MTCIPVNPERLTKARERAGSDALALAGHRNAHAIPLKDGRP
jgi:hypothetical protein